MSAGFAEKVFIARFQLSFTDSGRIAPAEGPADLTAPF
jgi:hypothetical protein